MAEMEHPNNKKLRVASSSSSRDDFIPELPDDLIPSIFSKLPVKSLCRFKCLSKSIHSMIQDPVFVDENRSKDPFCWAMFNDFDEDSAVIHTANPDGSAVKTRNLTFPYPIESVKQCNGLIAFYNGKRLLLRNLTNGVMIHIPTVWEPSDMGYFEFGFDSLSKKYKVLIWLERKASDYYVSDVHIRTLEKDSSWRPIKDILPFRHLGRDNPQVNAGGTLFWFDVDEARIISFDLADETFGIAKLPDEIDFEKDFKHSVFEFDGYLALVELPDPEDQVRGHFEIINLWILKDVASHQWISMLKNTIIPVEGTNLNDFYMYEECAPVADFSSRNGEIQIAAADGDHQYIFLYSFLNGQFKRITLTGFGTRHIKVKNHVVNHVDIKEFGELTVFTLPISSICGSS